MPRQARHHPPGVPRWDGGSARRARTGPQRHRPRGHEVHRRRLEQLQTEGHEIRDEAIARLSPLKHRNLNLLGRYSFTASVPAGELQRELTYDGLNVAEAKGIKGGRAAVAAATAEAVRTGYLEGRSVAALARDHRVGRVAIRTAVSAI